MERLAGVRKKRPRNPATEGGAAEREGEDMAGSNAVDPQGGPKRRTRRNVNQNLGCVYCWATDAETGQPCTSRSAEGSNLPYCERHRRDGDGAIQVLDHPEDHAVGKIVVANIDLPKGYKFVYWGKRCRWRGCKGEDRAMSFRPNGGVIDPTGCEGQQVQFMACPGPSERSNIKCTDVCFGKTYDTSLVGREIETSEPVKKNHQLLQWYGSKEWFESRGIPRTNVGTEAHPAPQRKKKLKSATEGGRKRKAKGQLKPEVGTSGQEHVKPEEDVMLQLTPKGLLVASDLLEVGGRPFEVGRPQPKQGSLFSVSPHQPFSPPSQLTPSFLSLLVVVVFVLPVLDSQAGQGEEVCGQSGLPRPWQRGGGPGGPNLPVRPGCGPQPGGGHPRDACPGGDEQAPHEHRDAGVGGVQPAHGKGFLLRLCGPPHGMLHALTERVEVQRGLQRPQAAGVPDLGGERDQDDVQQDPIAIKGSGMEWGGGLLGPPPPDPQII